MFVVLQLACLAISAFRRVYDTRVFTRIYTSLASQLVVQQRRSEVAVSRVVARSALSREFVQFFEQYLPCSLESLYTIVGALVMLALYDRVLVPVCLAMLLPVWILSRVRTQCTLARRPPA